LFFRRRKKKRLVIIGLDGIPYRLIKELAEDGTLPHIAHLMGRGTFREMASSIPEVSSVAWSSIITGVNPAVHGIFGFTELAPGSYRLTFPNFAHLKAPPFWQKNPDRTYVIMNVPSTYPAASLNGVMISGFVALDLEKATYPPTMVSVLKDLGYRIDVDSQKAHQSLELFLKDLDLTLKSRIKAYRYLWDNISWDTFMLTFTGTDRLAHFLWEAYEDPGHRHHKDFLGHLVQIDEVIGEISSKMKEDEPLILLSDHGFERVESNVYINALLRREGFLKMKDGSSQNYSDLDPATKAFALDPARIYIHTRDRYPRGTVREGDRERIIEDLETLFHSLEQGGKRVIKRVYHKEELFSGPWLKDAPDLILLSQPGFDLKASLKARETFGKEIFTGKHTQHDAFLLVKAPGQEKMMPERPSVFDVARIIEFLEGGKKVR